MQDEDLKTSMQNSFICLFLSTLTDMTLPSGDVNETGSLEHCLILTLAFWIEYSPS